MVIYSKYHKGTGPECVFWIELAHSTDQWQSLANMTTYFCAP